ncbi:MAG: hypothetical protein PHC88_08860 [Terrimicrobiaceae bacterium]|nr:hypothetical protein [Terrimicrobiaceae bacterium]
MHRERMLAGTIRKRLAAAPFKPFIIRMKDGRAFEVRHQDFAEVSPKGSMVIVFDEDDSAIELSSLLIASVEPLKPETAAPTAS